MKTRSLPLLAVLSIALVLLLAAANFIHPAGAAAHPAVIHAQATPPPPVDRTVIGSTDGVMLMGVVITAIIVIPFLFRKK